MTKLAKCCNPIPGDRIIGYVSRGNGITIHREDCHTLNNYEFERLIECDWKNSSSSKTFIGNIDLICANSNAVYSDISKKVTDNKLEIVSLNVRPIKDHRNIISMGLRVSSKNQLEDMIKKLKLVPNVIDVFRNN